ncbi:hypothetical protein [Haliscomenobacter hydrossis]|uniref:MORN variant repeat-containing protein n=1 Tax=Haliscomenobacter hydrossis (strain ATCC 27775 / DSM 1100 / LMG 10767 / O) TaxID=760192 RepID=F4KZD0_HALH1|nr:hypothetical protein [Haliscomenobacter hydrossis]AEE48425.1 hypothetical protein Halhy_0515 [Haliscomenobacter hydrossis DSM 1100]
MRKPKTYILPFLCLICFNEVIAQSKDYYYENQTRYGTFRNYVNGGSKLISGTDYAAEIAKSQEEARQMATERQRQRQIELERMRNSSNSNQTNTNYTPANDARFETLKYPNGDTYIGNTLNAEPHGEGTHTFARDGRVMKGEFKNGLANGMMTITDRYYVQTGKFVDGVPVGDQRYDYDDGETNLVEIRNMETGASSVEYPDRTSFSGISDENGKYLKGKVKYTSGITFDGDFLNGSPYRGVWEHDGRIMIGEFGDVTSSQIYLKFGYHYDPKTKTQIYGSFTPEMKRIGYARAVRPDNTVQHFIYGENETEIYVFNQFPSGNILTLKANQDGYDYVGTLYTAATNELEPVSYTKPNGPQVIPATDPLAEKAFSYSREVAPAINTGKQEYEAKLVELQPYFDAYNSSTSSATYAFSNWQEATEKFTWNFLEAPSTDQNVHRYLEDEVLKFKTNSSEYTWSITNLNQSSPASYSYEADYQFEKELMNEGAGGILIDIDEKNGNNPSKLLFMISPMYRTYYFGIFSFVTYWTAFSRTTETGWVASDAINGFAETGVSNNSLKLEKTGDQISVYVNGQHLFTQKIAESGRPLGNFVGVGVVQKGMAKGQVSNIKFQMSPNR